MKPIYKQVGYYAACPDHPDKEVQWLWNGFFQQEVPNSCSRCDYDLRRNRVLKERAMGRHERKKDRDSRVSLTSISGMLKQIYAKAADGRN